MQWLIVRLSGVEFALPMEPVREMMQLRGQTLCAIPPCGQFRYCLRVNGAWLPVGVPHERLGLRPRPISARSCVVLAESTKLRGSPVCYGIMVDSISRTEVYKEDELRPTNPETGEPLPYTLGRLRWNGKWHLALDLGALFPRQDLEKATLAPTAA